MAWWRCAVCVRKMKACCGALLSLPACLRSFLPAEGAARPPARTPRVSAPPARAPHTHHRCTPQAFTVRVSGELLLDTLLQSFGRDALAAALAAVERRMSEAAQARAAGQVGRGLGEVGGPGAAPRGAGGGGT